MPRTHTQVMRAGSMDASLLALARMRVAARLGRTLCRHPVDVLGLLVLAGGGLLILGNALFMQAGAHPAPMSNSAAPVSNTATPMRVASQPTAQPRVDQTGSLATLPKPADPFAIATPAAADRNRLQLLTEIQRQLGRRGFYDGAVDGIYGPRMDAAIRDFEQAAGLRAGGEPSEQLLRAIMKSSATAKERTPDAPAQALRREQDKAAPKVVAIQRALSDHGYGQIKANGVLDGETRAAIEKFERERKLPVTGQVTHRLSRELAAVTGRPLE